MFNREGWSYGHRSRGFDDSFALTFLTQGHAREFSVRYVLFFLMPKQSILDFFFCYNVISSQMKVYRMRGPCSSWPLMTFAWSMLPWIRTRSWNFICSRHQQWNACYYQLKFFLIFDLQTVFGLHSLEQVKTINHFEFKKETRDNCTTTLGGMLKEIGSWFCQEHAKLVKQGLKYLFIFDWSRIYQILHIIRRGKNVTTY